MLYSLFFNYLFHSVVNIFAQISWESTDRSTSHQITKFSSCFALIHCFGNLEWREEGYKAKMGCWMKRHLGWVQTGKKKEKEKMLAAEGTTSAAEWRLVLLLTDLITLKRWEEEKTEKERQEKRAKLQRIRSGRGRRNRGVNGFFVFRELVYFQARKSNSQ